MLAVDISFFPHFWGKKMLLTVTLCVFYIGYDYEYLVFYGDHPWHCRR